MTTELQNMFGNEIWYGPSDSLYCNAADFLWQTNESCTAVESEGDEHLYQLNVNNGRLMEAHWFGVIKLSCQSSIEPVLVNWREHMLTFECFLCGSANDVKAVGSHLETLCCRNWTATNRSWHHASYEESVTADPCACVFSVHFWEGSVSAVLRIFTHAEQIFGLCFSFIASPRLPNLNIHIFTTTELWESLLVVKHLTCWGKWTCTC